MKLHVFVLAMLVAATTSSAFGQMPEPYGAWRGKIRYVEGPYRTRTHIRWGGGLTPVGGQVLMHLGSVAGNVATDPNFWSGISGLPGTQRDAQLNPALTGTIADVQATNAKLLADLNALRARPDIGLPPLEFTAATPGSATIPGMPPPPTVVSPGGPPPAQGSFSGRMEQWQSLVAEAEQLRAHTATQLAIARAVSDRADAAALDPQQVANVKRASEAPLLAVSSSPEVADTSPAQFQQAYGEAKTNLEQLKAKLQEATNLGRQLRQEDPQTFDRPERQQLLGKLEQDLAAVQAIQL